jgi:hypothetical protein
MIISFELSASIASFDTLSTCLLMMTYYALSGYVSGSGAASKTQFSRLCLALNERMKSKPHS